MRTHHPIFPDTERLAGVSEGLASVDDDPVLIACVREATQVAGTPIALVSLVLRSVQLFCAQVGLPPDLAASRATSRGNSFCQFVVRDDAPFEVRNAKVDSRVPTELVDEYGIQAYLGVPLRVGDSTLGSLCVIDTQPRTFSPDVRDALEKIALRVASRLNEKSGEHAAFELTEPSLAAKNAKTSLIAARSALSLVGPQIRAAGDMLVHLEAPLPVEVMEVLTDAVYLHQSLEGLLRSVRTDLSQVNFAPCERTEVDTLLNAAALALVEAAPWVRLVEGFESSKIDDAQTLRAGRVLRESLNSHDALSGALTSLATLLESKIVSKGGVS